MFPRRLFPVTCYVQNRFIRLIFFKGDEEIEKILDDMFLNEAAHDETAENHPPEPIEDEQNNDNINNAAVDSSDHAATHPIMALPAPVENSKKEIILTNILFQISRMYVLILDTYVLSCFLFINFYIPHLTTETLLISYTVEVAQEQNPTQQQDNQLICDICGKCFSTKWNLKRHTIHFHPKFKICLICKKEYKFEDNLINHVQVFHKDAHDTFHPSSSGSFSCTYCGQYHFEMKFRFASTSNRIKI